MSMTSMKQNFDTAAEVKKRHEAVCFMLSIIESELKEIISSPDFGKLGTEQKEQLVISRAKAIRFWKLQLDDYMDKNISAWINRAAQAKSKELDMSLRDVVTEYGDMTFIPHEEDTKKPEEEEKPVAEEIPDSDEDILGQLIAGQ